MNRADTVKNHKYKHTGPHVTQPVQFVCHSQVYFKVAHKYLYNSFCCK